MQQGIIERINQLWAEYKELQSLSSENRQKLEKKFRLEFNYNSNHLEGNTLTYGETELLLLFDDTKGGHNMREYEEMKAHDVAYQLVQQWADDPRPLAETDIKNLNKTILVQPFWKDAITPDGQDTKRLIIIGEYKQQPNSVRLANGEMFDYASPTDTPIQMGELIQWYNTETEKNDAHPLLLAALLHYRFVRIHPFDDGNGRVARLLMNYVLLTNGLPPIIIKSADKKNYLRALNAADTGDTETFLEYIGEQLLWSLELAIKAAKGERIEELNDLDKELALLTKQLAEKTVLSVQATPDTVDEAFRQNLAVLFMALEEKLNTLKPYFFEIGRDLQIQVQGGQPTAYGMPINSEEWNNFFAELRKKSLVKLNERVINIQYSYVLRGFKNNMAANNYSVYIETVFSEYNFTINEHLGEKKSFQFPYGYQLSKEEMQEIIAAPIKRIIAQIRNINQR